MFRTTYYASGAETCDRLAQPQMSCYTVRAVRGRGAASKDAFEWGPAGIRDGKLETIALVAGKPSCMRESIVASYEIDGDRLRLTSVGPNCLGQKDGEASEARRSPAG